MENMRIHSDNLSQQKEEETIWWQKQLSYYKVFHRISVSNRNEKKTQLVMNKTVYLGLSVQKLSTMLM